MSVDYESWAQHLSTLLDRIECETNDLHAYRLCKQRFEIARQYGMTVEFSGETTGTLQ